MNDEKELRSAAEQRLVGALGYLAESTKNQASFDRDLEQYQTDCKLLKKLSGG